MQNLGGIHSDASEILHFSEVLPLMPDCRLPLAVRLGRADNESIRLREVVAMRAEVGSRIRIHGARVGNSERHGEVLETRGEDGGPPYLVRFDDGGESLIFPGPDCELERQGDADDA